MKQKTHIKKIISFAESIIIVRITVSKADEDQSNLSENIEEFKNKSRKRTKNGYMKI